MVPLSPCIAGLSCWECIRGMCSWYKGVNGSVCLNQGDEPTLDSLTYAVIYPGKECPQIGPCGDSWYARFFYGVSFTFLVLVFLIVYALRSCRYREPGDCGDPRLEPQVQVQASVVEPAGEVQPSGIIIPPAKAQASSESFY